jgi:ComF family protein
MGGENVKNTIVDKMLEFVAPHLCCGCNKTGSLLCEHCKYDIIKNSFTTCILCEGQHMGEVCSKTTLPYKKAWCVGPREDVLQRLIGSYKFQNMKAAARDLALLLDARLPTLPADTLLVPIPTAASHIRKRGYDHLLLIAQYLAGLRRLRVASQLLGRKETASQHGANRKDRIAQAATAFRLIGNVQPHIPYLVIDDVLTTGATIKSAGQLLADAGAQQLSLAIIARQPLD